MMSSKRHSMRGDEGPGMKTKLIGVSSTKRLKDYNLEFRNWNTKMFN
jgi:hypothetical protein